VAALVIALGPPCGFLVFAGVARILEAIMGKSPNAIHAIPIPVIAMGCAVFFWAFLLNIFLRLTFLSWNLLWFMQAAVLLLLLFGFAYGIDSATKALWGKSIFMPVFIAAEQIGAAAFLAARSASLAGGARTRNG
jgi:hypothetical protein